MLSLSKYFLSESHPSTKCTEFISRLLAELKKVTDSDLLHKDEYMIFANFQRDILNQTVQHPKAIQYPPSLLYQRSALKAAINWLEEQNIEVIDDIYEIYSELISKPCSQETYSYRTYLLDETGELSVTLQESKPLVVNGTTGLQTWEAAKFLTEWICERKDYVKDKNVLELGCGIGLTGLVICCLCQPRRFVFTDCHPMVLDVLQKNIRLNHVTMNSSVQVEVQELNWENELVPAWSDAMDVILAADVIFDPSLFPGLSKVFSHFLTENNKSEIILSCAVRNTVSLNQFLTLLVQLKLKIEELSTCSAKMFFYGNSEIKLYKISR